jgi:DNA-binding beta-propeller fold protein YncE
VWVTVRGENYVSVLDGTTYEEKTRITTPNGPGMQIFSPDGMYGYVCSSFTPETDIFSVADHTLVGKVQQVSPFCPNIAATPDGSQVWFTLKDTGKVQVFNAKPPFTLLQTLDTGPITNHVNIVRNAHGQFAYVTVGGLNQVKVFRTADFSLVALAASMFATASRNPNSSVSSSYTAFFTIPKSTAAFRRIPTDCTSCSSSSPFLAASVATARRRRRVRSTRVASSAIRYRTPTAPPSTTRI